MIQVTVAVCVYNGADQLPQLIAALRDQHCTLPFEILVVDNNSTDGTAELVRRLAKGPGTPLRLVEEREQGIPYARNRAINSSQSSRYLAFVDVDELPAPQWLSCAIDALEREGAECVGGEIQVRFPHARPHWLDDELLGFLGALNHGAEPFWIKKADTPVWSGNVAYRTSVFDNGLRFDERYNRRGKGIGGGSDAIMFRSLLERKTRIRYRPDMLLEHHVEASKLKRTYFLRLHFIAGRKHGQFQLSPPPRAVFGIAPYMIRQAATQWAKTVARWLRREPGVLRQAMNGAYATGIIYGRFLDWKERRRSKGGEQVHGRT